MCQSVSTAGKNGSDHIQVIEAPQECIDMHRDERHTLETLIWYMLCYVQAMCNLDIFGLKSAAPCKIIRPEDVTTLQHSLENLRIINTRAAIFVGIISTFTAIAER